MGIKDQKSARTDRQLWEMMSWGMFVSTRDVLVGKEVTMCSVCLMKEAQKVRI